MVEKSKSSKRTAKMSSFPISSIATTVQTDHQQEQPQRKGPPAPSSPTRMARGEMGTRNSIGAVVFNFIVEQGSVPQLGTLLQFISECIRKHMSGTKGFRTKGQNSHGSCHHAVFRVNKSPSLANLWTITLLIILSGCIWSRGTSGQCTKAGYEHIRSSASHHGGRLALTLKFEVENGTMPKLRRLDEDTVCVQIDDCPVSSIISYQDF